MRFKMETKTSFILFADQAEVINELSDEDAGKLMKAVYNYAATGEVPNFEGILKFVFIPIRQSIDKNTEKYNAVVEKRRIAGSKGGKQRVANQANATFAKQTQANQADNDSDSVSVYDSDNNKNVITQKENKEKVVCDEEKPILKSNFYATHPHPDLMFDSDVNRIYDIYKENCPDLIPVGFGLRDLKKRQRIKEFLNIISGDFDYFKRVCIKANKLKVIAGNKIDIDSVMNNHNGIDNDKYQAQEAPIDFQAMARSVADRMNKENTT